MFFMSDYSFSFAIFEDEKEAEWLIAHNVPRGKQRMPV